MTLEGIKSVRLNNYTEYDSEKCNNGGCYGFFWTDYTRLDDGRWKVSYGTTADIKYCPCCGMFGDHYEDDDSCYESGYSCGEFDMITEKQLLQIIENFENKKKKKITVNLAKGQKVVLRKKIQD